MKLQKLIMDMLLPMIIIKSFPFYVELMFSVKVKHCIVRLWLLGLQFRTTYAMIPNPDKSGDL